MSRQVRLDLHCELLGRLGIPARKQELDVNESKIRLPRVDARGKALRVGDVVRGIAALSERPDVALLVGRYTRIIAFDEDGVAELRFSIRTGRHAGYHVVWIKPSLLVKRRGRTGHRRT